MTCLYEGLLLPVFLGLCCPLYFVCGVLTAYQFLVVSVVYEAGGLVHWKTLTTSMRVHHVLINSCFAPALYLWTLGGQPAWFVPLCEATTWIALSNLPYEFYLRTKSTAWGVVLGITFVCCRFAFLWPVVLRSVRAYASTPEEWTPLLTLLLLGQAALGGLNLWWLGAIVGLTPNARVALAAGALTFGGVWCWGLGAFGLYPALYATHWVAAHVVGSGVLVPAELTAGCYRVADLLLRDVLLCQREQEMDNKRRNKESRVGEAEMALTQHLFARSDLLSNRAESERNRAARTT